jgi:hypothetical protein
MQPPAIRTDMIGACFIHGWLTQHMPELAAQWTPDVDDMVRGFAERVKVMMPAIELIFTGQSAIAQLAIEHWRLERVAYLGAGTPTPFSPLPGQLLYYTDANEGAVAEAERQGYNTRRVNVREPDDLRQIADASTLLATGLIHFLPAEAAQNVFRGFAFAGFRYFVFNHMQGLTDDEMRVPAEWHKLGFNLFSRGRDEMEPLYREYWREVDVIPFGDLIDAHPTLRPYFDHLRNGWSIYYLESRLPARA